MKKISILLTFCLLAGACASDGSDGSKTKRLTNDPQQSISGDNSAALEDSEVAGVSTKRGIGSKSASRIAGVGIEPLRPSLPGGKFGPALGVSADKIDVVYYWKGDRTRTSPFLQGSGQEANVDEADAFRTLVEWVNRNSANGSALMGFPFDLHGRKLNPIVVEAGQTSENNIAEARRIATEIKPFAALAAHGSVSAYACPVLASVGIYNLGTYSLRSNVGPNSGGFCLPGGATFENQVEAVTNYVSGRVAPTRYNSTSQRVFGFVFAEYPGLIEEADNIVDTFRAAGINIPKNGVASMSAELAKAGQQAGGVVSKMQDAGVNTIIFPDAGAPLAFLRAATSAGYTPDYVVWPCSGQDANAMVRLYDTAQWQRARGLTCYDAELMPDIAVDDLERSTEYYKAYQAIKRGDPPATTAYVWAALLPLLVGITNAGRSLDHDTFRAGVERVELFRYSARTGRVGQDANSLLIALRNNQRPLLGDFTELQWSNTARRTAGSSPGTYIFPESGTRRASSFDWR